MKTVLAVLGVVVLVLGFALWKRNASARASLETASAALAGASNKLTIATIQLTHQEQLAAVARSDLDERARELAALSNAVAALRSDLSKSQADAKAAWQGDRDSQARAAAAEEQSAGLTRKVEELVAQVRSLTRELEQVRSNAAKLYFASLAQANEAECLNIERLEQARRWNDPDALRLQLRRLESQELPFALLPTGIVDQPATLPR